VKNNNEWVKNLSGVMAALLLMAAAGYFMLTDHNETDRDGTLIVASFIPVELPTKEKKAESNANLELEEEVLEEKDSAAEKDSDIKTVPSEFGEKTTAVSNGRPTPAEDTKPDPVIEEKKTPVALNTSAAVVDHEPESKPVESVTEAPAVQPAANEAPAVKVEEPQLSTAPVSYNWVSSANYVFRMEVKISNNGSETAKNVTASVPLLENSSPYQTTRLKSVNFNIVSSSGRVSTFNLGEIAPGETKTIIADFDTNVRSFSINSSNETLDRAREIYEQYAGPGHCRDLCLKFINKCREQGITAREVIGFARTQRGAMTSGSLQGCRHSWAEINVEGLGWVPVDLTFQYFGAFPHTSHIVESYSDQLVKVNYTGGSLSASWSNAIM